MLFGNGFQPTEASDQVATWAEFLPADATYWLWASAGACIRA
jgi:hypothetical protein